MPPTRAIIWADAAQAGLVREVASIANLQIIATGSPHPDEAADLGEAVAVDRIDDLRMVAQHDDCELVWLASDEPPAADILRLLGQLQVRVISCEPLPPSIGEAGDAGATGGPTFLPRMQRSPGCVAAVDVLAQLGSVQCVSASFRSGRGQGALFARLYDAMDVIDWLCGPIESINASLAGPRDAVPHALPLLRGHMTGNLRFKANRCASVSLSDRGGAWFRGIDVLAEAGCLRITDAGFEWFGPDGRLIDRHHEPGSSIHAEIVAAQISRLLRDNEQAEPDPDHLNLLALCEAARLSCLTTQNEAPAKMIEMLSRP